ncbi:hypothetical protein P8452_51745 [Trifolium repens]|nr:hypothetical protein P8452_51745 [Trifolium repens]
MYNLYFIHCDPRLKELVVEGKAVWKNPSGYLPGRMAPMKIFFQFSCLLHMCCLESFGSFDILDIGRNETGIRPTGMTVWAVTRLIILIVSMVYGVVRPTLGGLHQSIKRFLLSLDLHSLSATLNKLQARRMMKLDMYRKFTNALAVAVVVSVGWICYEV